MTKLTTMLLLATLASCTTSTAIDGEDDSRSDDLTKGLRFHGFDPDGIEELDSKEGLRAIFAGDGFRNGFPLAVGAAIADPNAAAPTDLDVFQRSGELPSPPSRDVGLGPGPRPSLSRSVFARQADGDPDPTLLGNTNCFSCHAGVANNIVIAGLGNTHLETPNTYTGLLGLSASRDALTAAFAESPSTLVNELADFFFNTVVTILPIYRHAQSRGDNLGQFAVWSHLSRMSNTAENGLLADPEPATPEDESDLHKQFLEVELSSVDPLPWWLRKYRKTSYWYGEDATNIAAHFAFNFTTPHADVNENHDEHVEFIARILDFAEQTTSPVFPEALDVELVETGDSIFHRKCAGCHGSYLMNDSWKPGVAGGYDVHYDDLQPRLAAKDQTDRGYTNNLDDMEDIAKNAAGLSEYFAQNAPTTVVPVDVEYLAPPLDGIWASAPYLHNGSVPTLWHVLDSKSRPDVWMKFDNAPQAYNLTDVGLSCRDTFESDESWTSVSHACNGLRATDSGSLVDSLDRTFQIPNPADHAIYDTRDHGHGNGGHTYGDSLSDTDRLALIEFLKSLSGPNMVSTKSP